jgi:hypothetical protein
MIRGQEFHSVIKSVFDDVQGYNVSEQLSVNCPRCQESAGLSEPDGKYNLEINTAKRVFRCWKCDEPRFSGSLGSLIYQYGSKADYEIYKVYNQSYIQYNDDEIEQVHYVVVELPAEIIYFSKMDITDPDHLEAYNYMVIDRKISKEILLKYNIGFCIIGKYKKRIIIPSYDKDGNVNYFVARNYDKKYKKIKPYDNPKANKSSIIFNEGLINWDMTVYIVEGAFEMLSLPINTVPLLGKTITDALFFKLKELQPNVVVLLDPDAFKNTVDLFFKLQTIYVGCEEKLRLIELPNNDDLDEMRRYYGDDRVIETLYSVRGLTIDDYFIKKIDDTKRSERYNTYSEYFRH